MENSKVKGDLHQVQGKLMEKWGQGIGDGLDQIGGEREQWIGHLQERLGLTRAEAERELESLEERHGGLP